MVNTDSTSQFVLATFQGLSNDMCLMTAVLSNLILFCKSIHLPKGYTHKILHPLFFLLHMRFSQLYAKEDRSSLIVILDKVYNN